MPVYEFYCTDCHTIFKFLSRRINTDASPDCPKCGRAELERQLSMFAISKGRKEEEEDSPLPPGLDESRMEEALMSMAAEAEHLDEDDPKQAARMMRRLYETTGMKPTEGMHEALRRMEAGEDPDQVEADMGDVFEGEELFDMSSAGQKIKSLRSTYLRPDVDDTLYEL